MSGCCSAVSAQHEPSSGAASSVDSASSSLVRHVASFSSRSLSVDGADGPVISAVSPARICAGSSAPMDLSMAASASLTAGGGAAAASDALEPCAPALGSSAAHPRAGGGDNGAAPSWLKAKEGTRSQGRCLNKMLPFQQRAVRTIDAPATTRNL